MISMEEYQENPCRSLSVPYWKWKDITLPETMAIVHKDQYIPEAWEGYTATQYFRLYHDLRSIPERTREDITIRTASERDVDKIVDIINRSYEEIQVSQKQIHGYRKLRVFQENLWIIVQDAATGETLGCAMADCDEETGEIPVEWVQVLPQYRGRGVGADMVLELLRRGKHLGSYATVSGRVDNQTKPERLYRKCGFSGQDIWYVLNK